MPKPAPVIGAVALLFVVLALHNLGSLSLWQDEGWDMYVATAPWTEAWEAARGIEMHPPLHHLLLRVWVAAFGATPLAARLPSVLASVGTLLVLAWGLRTLAGARQAALGSAMLALSAGFLAMTQEVRVHPLHALAWTTAAVLLARAVDAPDAARVRQACAGMLGVAVVDQWGPVLMLACNAAVLVLQRPLRARAFPFSTWVWGQAALAPIAAWEVYRLLEVRASASALVYAPPHAASDYLRTLYYLAVGIGLDAAPLSAPQAVVTIAVTLGVVGAGLWATLRSERPGLLALVFMAVLPWVAAEPIYAVTHAVLATERRLGFTWPLIVGIAACGLVAVWDLPGAWRRQAGRAAVVAALAWLLGLNALSSWHWQTDARYARQDWRDATAWLARRLQPGDAVVLQNSYSAYVYRYYMADAPPAPLYLLTGANVDVLERISREHGRVWWVSCLAFTEDPDLRVAHWLNDHGRVEEHMTFENRAQPSADIVILGFRFDATARPR